MESKGDFFDITPGYTPGRTKRILPYLIGGGVALAILIAGGITAAVLILRPNFSGSNARALQPVPFPSVGSQDAAKCFYNGSSGLARLEPPSGSFLFGFSPKWVNGQMSADISQRLGFNAPLFNTFISMTSASFQPDTVEWNCKLVAQQQGVLELTLIPQMRADQIPSTFYPAFALHLRNMNSKYGVPILLRFMPEMNGSWMKYGIQELITMIGTIPTRLSLTNPMHSPRHPATHRSTNQCFHFIGDS